MRYGNEEEQSRKLFVGGLSLNTTDDGLSAYFSKYGNLTDCVVIRDKSSNKSKGFGFVTYETEEEADRCMQERPHSLDGRTVDAKRAVSREESSKPGAHVQVKKIFVGGLKPGSDESMLHEYFGQFGTILEVEIPRDRETNNPKGFGFVTFDDYDVADKLVAKRHHDVCGFKCEVKKALSRDEMDKAKQHLETKSRFGGGGGGGPMRGGRGGGGRGGRGGRRGGSAGGDSYGGGYGGGPMRGKMNQSQRSSGPYGAGYGSAGGYSSGGYGSDYSGGYGQAAGGYGQAASGGYGQTAGGYGAGGAAGTGYGSYGGGSQSYGYSGNGYSGYQGQGTGNSGW